MPVHASDVAREIRRHLPGAGSVKIHKLLYFAQGMHLARFGEEMFSDRIEAWAMGPVVPDLWRDERYERTPPDPVQLSADHLGTLEEVVARYGRLTGKALIKLTHAEGPWVTVTEDPLQLVENPQIDTAVMRDYFKLQLEVEMAEAREAAGRLAVDFPHYRLEVPEVTPALSTAIDEAIKS